MSHRLPNQPNILNLSLKAQIPALIEHPKDITSELLVAFDEFVLQILHAINLGNASNIELMEWKIYVKELEFIRSKFK